MRIFSLSLFLFICLTLFPFGSEASVSLGAVPRETPGLKSNFQALQLKSLLAKYLGEKVELRLFASRADLLRQLETVKIDFAIIDPDFLAAHATKLVSLGSLDKSEKLLVATRPPGEGESSRQVAMALVKMVARGEDGRVAAVVPQQIVAEPSGTRPAAERPPESPPAAQTEPATAPAATSMVSTAAIESDEFTASAAPVPEIIAQPDIPLNLRPPNVPGSRSARMSQPEPPQQVPQSLAAPAEGTPMLLLSEGGSPVLVLPSKSWEKTPKPAALLPEMDAEPNVIYVVPFTTIMVPTEIREQVFDEFVDILNEHGAGLNKKFVIFKGKVDENAKKFLDSRKHVTGEIYGYVEDVGCCSTNIQTHVKLKYFHANDKKLALEYSDEYKAFFDHDRAALPGERKKLANKIISIMTSKMLKVLDGEMIASK